MKGKIQMKGFQIKKWMTFSLLFIASVGTCHAEWTTIRTNFGEGVQCNKWGWVYGNYQTAWHNTCTPLEVKTEDYKVYSIPTTKGVCKNEDAVALYEYTSGDTKIEFIGCYPLSKIKYLENIKR